LGDQEKWPSEGSLNYNTIQQIGFFCKREEKWMEVPYVQLFFYLQDHPEWLHNCYLGTQTLAALCKAQDKCGEEGPEKPLTSNKDSVSTALSTAPPSSPPSESPNILDLIMSVSPLQQAVVGRGKVYIPL
jgi:hypothetical protein